MYSVLSTVVPSAIYASASVVLFWYLRALFPYIYQRRSLEQIWTETQHNGDRPSVSSKSLFRKFYDIPDAHLLRRDSVDGFLFLRFLRMTVLCCFMGCIMIWPVLLPVSNMI